MGPSGEARRVADEILVRIVSGAYPAGLRLPAEADLAAALSCGRSTVREALGHLTNLGIVKSRRGSGAMVLDFRREGTPALLPAYLGAGRFDRPVSEIARELLGVRTLLAAQAVRLAARYADPGALADARALLARLATLTQDPVAHGETELDFFRALVTASGIWPAVWLANVFWAPMREITDRFAGAVGRVPADYQRKMGRLMDLIEARDEAAAEALVIAWFARVDAALVRDLEAVLAPSAAPPASRNGAGKPAPAKKVTRAKQASPPAPAVPAKQASRVKQGNRKASNPS